MNSRAESVFYPSRLNTMLRSDFGSGRMSDENSISEWIGCLRAGDRDAAQLIWKRFVDRLLRLARAKLAGRVRREADEEDVVLSVFDAAFQGIRDGRFSKIDDRDDLWQVLV